jgi:transposase
MFPRIKSFKNKDGSLRHYLYLVETKRISGRVKQVITANFGRLDEADKNLPDIIEKLSRFTKRLKVINLSRDMKSDWVKEYGPVIIFRRIWGMLGLDKCLKKYLKPRKIGFDAEELIYTMVLNRLMDPKSELAVHEWSKFLYGITSPKDLNQWYRALDFLIAHKEIIEKDLFESQKDLFNQEIDVVLMDTTSLVYFGDGDKAEGILDYGYSKEKRFDLKQVIVGVLMTKDGLPIGHEVYPGNTNDISAFKEMIRAVKIRFKIRKIIIVCDRGMVSEDNIMTLEQDGYEYVVGMRMRQLKEEDAKKILSVKDMTSVTKDLKGKEVHFKGRRLIVCFNEEESLKDKKKRQEIIARLVVKLKTQGLKSLLVHKEYSKYLKIKADKPSLDEERVKHEELFDGKFVIETNTRLNWKEVVLAYKDLWRIEAGFRTLKAELEMGPVYHYTERRIRAHIFISFLALVLKGSFHKALLNTDKSLNLTKVLEDVRKIKATQVTIKDAALALRTELEGDAHLAFKAVGLKIPPRILDNPQDIQENVVVRLS